MGNKAVRAALVALLASAALALQQDAPTLTRFGLSLAAEQRAFKDWVSTSPQRSRDVAAFFQFLSDEGVDDVLPSWTLLIPDRQVATAQCPLDQFILPPRNLWPEIVPTLRYLRSHVIPVTGPIRLVSGYRPPAFNRCRGGAKGSRHMTFSALDLVPIDQTVDGDVFFGELCDLWQQTPQRLSVGLGTYWSGSRAQNPTLRFHIDTKGQRTWGYSYTSDSSFCRTAR
jgi:Peptidase M15